MLVEGVNDDARSVGAVARFLGDAHVTTAYLAVPTRPPAEAGVRAPDEATVARAYRIMAEHVGRVELLVGDEGDAFAASGDPRADLLAITAVHPLRESAVRGLLGRSGCGWEVVDELQRDGLVVAVEHAGERFLVRRFHTLGRT
jgi:wyosine [tRNA(Phe)-imidazoG37] synthetase (radical SAM superfamily)